MMAFWGETLRRILCGLLNTCRAVKAKAARSVDSVPVREPACVFISIGAVRDICSAGLGFRLAVRRPVRDSIFMGFNEFLSKAGGRHSRRRLNSSAPMGAGGASASSYMLLGAAPPLGGQPSATLVSLAAAASRDTTVRCSASQH